MEIRERCHHHHMDLMAKIVTRLKSVPEGKGTMFDNTMVVYFPLKIVLGDFDGLL